MVKYTVKWADDWGNAFAVVKRNSIVALAFSVDIGLIAGADRVAETTFLEEARFA